VLADGEILKALAVLQGELDPQRGSDWVLGLGAVKESIAGTESGKV